MDFSVIDRVGLLSEMYFSCTIPPAANATEVPELPPLTFAVAHQGRLNTLRARTHLIPPTPQGGGYATTALFLDTLTISNATFIGNGNHTSGVLYCNKAGTSALIMSGWFST